MPENLAEYTCKLCQGKFMVRQGSRRTLCESCQDKQAGIGIRRAAESRRKKGAA